ncbi:g- beta wd-40 repeat-containing [Pyrenophora seminiperda CCB06]|uniref:G-beta wd-40 repeat-containing n=1 Tax=Pyrenophora seminiperda CCB06 TaxID=1302712 RepID=A0A3M7LY82_9PLEO|nr:g- beta wd-40 repeat-containing [Pyrenophora seminiperda CCB06]
MRTKEIIAATLVPLVFFLAAMALVTRFLQSKHAKPAMAETDILTTDGKTLTPDGKSERQVQLLHVVSAWKRLLAPKQDADKIHWVPSLSGIIKAGDEGLFSSALFLNLQGTPGPIALETLYNAFANEIRAERSSYPGDMTKFLAQMKKPTVRPALGGSVGRSRSMLSRRADASTKMNRKSMDLSAAEMGLTRALSVKKPAAVFVSMRSGLPDAGTQKASQKSWVKDGQTAKYHDHLMSIKVTASELAALSIILGTEITGTTTQDLSSEAGAYGISILSETTDKSKYHVTLQQNKISRSRRHGQRSGVSPLFAKHLAAGSLPYAQDKVGIHSILINEESCEALQAGASLYAHPYAARSPQTKFLASLPSSRENRFHILATSTEVHPSTTLLDAIAALPFTGGLPPLASAPLIKSVQFIASAGLPPAKLLQRLEGLVDKVHRHSPQHNIFGPLYEPQNAGALYRERERLGRLANDPSTPGTLAEKTARMSRYITLLERLMALIPDMKGQGVLEAVQTATKVELQHAYEQAVAAHRTSTTEKASITSTTQPVLESTPTKTTPNSVSPKASPRRSNRLSTISSQSNISAASSNDKESNLARQIEQVLKVDLPLDVATVAFVARMVIVAWTYSVNNVAWEDGEPGFRVPDVDALHKAVMS